MGFTFPGNLLPDRQAPPPSPEECSVSRGGENLPRFSGRENPALVGVQAHPGDPVRAELSALGYGGRRKNPSWSVPMQACVSGAPTWVCLESSTQSQGT